MANLYPTTTAAVDSRVLLEWTEHRDHEKLSRDARAVLDTNSIRDWLMGDISGHCQRLGLKSLDWLASDTEAPSRTSEHLDSQDRWWFVWTLYQSDIQASIEGLDRLVAYFHEYPARFGADAAEISAAHAWDKASGELEFEMPDPSSEGDTPLYVLCTILGFRRLLNFAHANGLNIIHMRYSFRP